MPCQYTVSTKAALSGRGSSGTTQGYGSQHVTEYRPPSSYVYLRYIRRCDTYTTSTRDTRAEINGMVAQGCNKIVLLLLLYVVLYRRCEHQPEQASVRRYPLRSTTHTQPTFSWGDCTFRSRHLERLLPLPIHLHTAPWHSPYSGVLDVW